MKLGVLTKNIIKLRLFPDIGDKKVRKMIAAYPELYRHEQTFTQLKQNLSSIGQHVVLNQAAMESEHQKVLDFINKNKCITVNYQQKEYPQQLKKIYSPPTLLFCLGTLKFNFHTSISIVGTRRYTKYGEEMCKKFVDGFAHYNFTVVSGLAAGIDTLAHKLSINQNMNCIGVVGHGLHFTYPIANHALYQSIVDKGGALISQFLPYEPPLRQYFPMRNRVIAGLTRGTLVIEAAEKSGSLITARYAFDEGREVYAVPADLTRPRSQGCNTLIKNQIARLVITPDEIVCDYGLSGHRKEEQWNPGENSNSRNNDYCSLREILSTERLTADELAGRLSMPIHEINARLTELELEGVVVKNELMQWMRVK